MFRVSSHSFISFFCSTVVGSNLGEWTTIHKRLEYRRFACSSKVRVDNFKNNLIAALKTSIEQHISGRKQPRHSSRSQFLL